MLQTTSMIPSVDNVALTSALYRHSAMHTQAHVQQDKIGILVGMQGCWAEQLEKLRQVSLRRGEL